MFYIRTLISFIKDKEYRHLLLTTAIVIGLGSTVYHFLEGWNWIDSAYFSVITLTTIGYGDFSPKTPEGKLFTIFYIIIGLGIFLSFINAVYDHYAAVKQNDGTKETDSSKQ